MNQRREAHDTPLASLRDKLLKYHDQVIRRKLKEREDEYDSLRERLNDYEAHISACIHREVQQMRKDEEVARMRKEEARHKRELLERIEHIEKLKLQQRSEDAKLLKVEEMMKKYGTLAAQKASPTSATSTKNGHTNNCGECREIVLSRCRRSVPRDGLLSFDFYNNNRNVQIIRAPSANLGVAGARALSQALSRGACPRLTELHLAWNAMGDGGIAYLLHALSLSPLRLCHLDLTGNDITSEGINALKIAVANKKATALVGLKYLSLRRNPIKAEGGKILAHMLLNGWLWPTLEVLDISSCSIGIAGLKALRSALSSEALAIRLAPKLEKVTARDNCASSEVANREGFWPNVLQI